MDQNPLHNNSLSESSQSLLSHETDPTFTNSNIISGSSTSDEQINNPDLTFFYPKSILNLNLSSCSTNKYLYTLDEHNHPFDLVEGILVLREMADVDHDRIADYLHHRLRYYASTHDETWCVHKECKIFISKHKKTTSPKNSSSPSTPKYDHTFRRVDVAVGYKESCCEGHCDNSPRSRTVTFSEDKRVPFMAIEITSTRSTRNDDLVSKRDQYLSRGVEQYVIIDRDKDNRHDKQKHKPSVICYLANNQGGSSSSNRDNINITRYQFQDDERIDVTLLKHLKLSPKDIFSCPPSDTWDVDQKKKEKLAVKEALKKKDEEKEEALKKQKRESEVALKKQKRESEVALKKAEEQFEIDKRNAIKEAIEEDRRRRGTQRTYHSPTGLSPKKKKLRDEA